MRDWARIRRRIPVRGSLGGGNTPTPGSITKLYIVATMVLLELYLCSYGESLKEEEAIYGAPRLYQYLSGV